jgi:hypothetical protein
MTGVYPAPIVGGHSLQLTVKNLSLEPPGPTANRIVLPQVGHRASYAVPSAFRYTRVYLLAQRKNRLRYGRPDDVLAGASESGVCPARGAKAPAMESSTMSSGSGVT